MSAPVVEPDDARRLATTRIGRLYILDGLPDVDLDARDVIPAWVQLHRVPSWAEVAVEVLDYGHVVLPDSRVTPGTL